MSNNKILIVDDDMTVRILMEQTLLDAGFDVISAENGQQGFELFEASVPDLIITDVHMPLLTGYELCQRIRQQPKGNSVPIIVMTGSSDNLESVKNAYEAGATDFVDKPLNWPSLPYRVKYLLRADKAIYERTQQDIMLRRLGKVIDNSSNEIYIIDGQSSQFISINLAARKNLGYAEQDVGQLSPFDCINFDDSQTITKKELKDNLDKLRCGESTEFHHEGEQIRKDGSTYPISISAYASTEENDDSIIFVAKDRTNSKAAEEKMQALAYFDQLTGLPNRTLFLKEFHSHIRRAARNKKRLALFFIDLDNFKDVNDSLGHLAGDELLKKIADILLGSVKHSDEFVGVSKPFVARFGGDEFVILLPSILEAVDIELLANRMVSALGNPIEIKGREFVITPSIGIAVYPEHGLSSDELLQKADIAMYEAKRSGRNIWCNYSNNIMTKDIEQLDMEKDLRAALPKKEFKLHYQPIIDIKTGDVVGVEALLRWYRANNSIVSPDTFIPLAEQSNLITPIGEWVIKESCHCLARLKQHYSKNLSMSINLSARQFESPQLASIIKKNIERHKLEPSSIHLEITESLFVKDIDVVILLLNGLKNIGCKISLDDFGTGYSSLSYLSKFPVDTLKIDRSFIGQIDSDANSSRITSAIIAMAKNLSLNVVAEGVENKNQLLELKRQNVDYVQGFLFSEPLEEEKLNQLLASEVKFTLQ